MKADFYQKILLCKKFKLDSTSSILRNVLLGHICIKLIEPFNIPYTIRFLKKMLLIFWIVYFQDKSENFISARKYCHDFVRNCLQNLWIIQIIYQYLVPEIMITTQSFLKIICIKFLHNRQDHFLHNFFTQICANYDVEWIKKHWFRIIVLSTKK